MPPLLRTVLAMKPKTDGSAPCRGVGQRGSGINLSRSPVQSGLLGLTDELQAHLSIL